MTTLRDNLINEYRTYRTAHNRAPNPWSVPNAREEAGYCLQYPAPLDILEQGLPHHVGPYWSAVRSLVVAAMMEPNR